VRRDAIDIVLERSQHLCLVDADVFFEFFHFVLVEGFGGHIFMGDDGVEGIAEIFDAAVHVLYLGGEKVAGGQDYVSIVVEV
jgi:hypothetical protein